MKIVTFNVVDRARVRESSRSRDASPKALPPRSEEIPLEDIAKVSFSILSPTSDYETFL